MDGDQAQQVQTGGMAGGGDRNHTCCLNFCTVVRSMKSVLPLGMRQLILPSSSPAECEPAVRTPSLQGGALMG